MAAAGQHFACTVLDVFFEPAPSQPTPEQRKWSPPLWDRPSEGTIPEVLVVNELVHQDDDGIVMVDTLGVYPNGFTIHVSIHLNPHMAEETRQKFHRISPMQWFARECGFPTGERAGDANPPARQVRRMNRESRLSRTLDSTAGVEEVMDGISGSGSFRCRQMVHWTFLSACLRPK